MTGFSRRGFFRLAAGAAALTQLPAISRASATIYADGIHCDAAGLEALLRGDVVEFVNAADAAHIGWQDGVLHLNGRFYIGRTVHFPDGFSGEVRGGHFTAIRSMRCMFDATKAQVVIISHMHLGSGRHNASARFRS